MPILTQSSGVADPRHEIVTLKFRDVGREHWVKVAPAKRTGASCPVSVCPLMPRCMVDMYRFRAAVFVDGPPQDGPAREIHAQNIETTAASTAPFF